MPDPRPLVLASASPRRTSLLNEAGLAHRVVPADGVEEAHDASLSPAELTEANARLKAAAVSRMHPEALVIGADTLVYLDDEPLGKPADLEEARVMLGRLSGRAHVVCTGVCLAGGGGGEIRTFHVLTQVVFKPLTQEGIAAYLSLVNPLDKAGSYGAQEQGEMIIERIDGSWSNVVGLPMEKLVEMLQGE